MDNHDFCRYVLKCSRQDAADIKVKIPTINSTLMHFEHYAVFIGDTWYDEYNECCAFMARSNAIQDYISAERDNLNHTHTT